MLQRKIVKNKFSLQVNLPKHYTLNLGWQYGDTLYLRQVGNNIILSNQKKKRPII